MVVQPLGVQNRVEFLKNPLRCSGGKPWVLKMCFPAYFLRNCFRLNSLPILHFTLSVQERTLPKLYSYTEINQTFFPVQSVFNFIAVYVTRDQKILQCPGRKWLFQHLCLGHNHRVLTPPPLSLSVAKAGRDHLNKWNTPRASEPNHIKFMTSRAPALMWTPPINESTELLSGLSC